MGSRRPSEDKRVHTTKCISVPVLSVTETVSCQSCKMKSLRAKTNTYIKTPVRGEESTFVVTGWIDAAPAKRNPLSCSALLHDPCIWKQNWPYPGRVIKS